MTIKKWVKTNTNRLDGETIAITGSTGGLGKELCFHLASLGANLIFLNRNEKKSTELGNQINEKFPNCKIEFVKVDMQDIQSVKLAIKELKNKNFNKIVFNAGAYKISRCTTSTGYDNIFQINFLSPYYMIRELMPKLREYENSKVVVVGSIAHNFSKSDPLNLDFANNKKCSKAYGNAKRYLMFSLYELFKDEKNVKLSICHPGITYTNITSHYPKLINIIIKYPMKVVFSSVKKASLTTLKGLFDETNYHTWIGPRLFSIWGYPKKKRLCTATSVESKKIGEIANKIYINLKNK